LKDGRFVADKAVIKKGCARIMRVAADAAATPIIALRQPLCYRRPP
jgi:hypothetical protein